MEQLLIEAAKDNFGSVKHMYHEEHESSHGRTVDRICTAIEIPKDHPQRKRWPGLRTLFVIETNRKTSDNAEPKRETRFYISSLAPNADVLADIVRQHWKTENQQHWNLDVSFGEDGKRARDKNALANLAAVMRWTLSLLRQEKTVKTSIRRKRYLSALDTRYLIKVLKAATF
jgi:predicted transposase YbfD/YdcC